MVVLSIVLISALVAFFLYHRLVITKLEQSLANFEAELDYMEDVIQTTRLHVSEMELAQIRRSQVKKAAKKRGRPVNPNSVRQKKMKASK
jgi:hypothetical protein